MSETKTYDIALVGHCGPDAFALTSAVRGFVPGSTVHKLNTQSELDAKGKGMDLLLVNRVLDGQFSDESGIDMIRRLSKQGFNTMLISNFPEALAEAEQAGGKPGFGKRAMRSPEAEGALKNALGIA